MNVTRLDPEHRYLDDAGAEWPSVTRILGTVPPYLGRFDQVPADRLEFKRQLGTAVHAAIALDVAGDLDPDSIDPAVLPYLDAWRRYCAESGFVPQHTEAVVWHESYHYAGTLDHLGTIGPGWWLIDTKTGSEADADLAGPQTAAYLEAARATLPNLPTVVKRASVHLRPDGTYRVTPHTSRRDWHVFLAALEIHRFIAARRHS